MSVGAVFVGDIGTRFLLDCGQDVSSATVRRVHYLKPDGTTDFWVAALDAGLEGIYYDIVADDIDISGNWKFQAYVEMPGWQGYGEIAVLKVYDPV